MKHVYLLNTGLYAVGEVSAGVHGRNRLGGTDAIRIHTVPLVVVVVVFIFIFMNIFICLLFICLCNF
jgi:hypothetical protein